MNLSQFVDLAGFPLILSISGPACRCQSSDVTGRKKPVRLSFFFFFFQIETEIVLFFLNTLQGRRLLV